jgi:23S rRNA (guanosine2251-2'-O)-methyltransferase
MQMKKIVIILCDVRSCYNVGSIFRTADSAGSTKIVLCGITPHPRLPNDPRPEKVIENNSKMIHKTALGAEESVKYSYQESPLEVVNEYKSAGYQVVALENKIENTENIFNFASHHDIALLVGSETSGLGHELLALCSSVVEIPMHGIKNSLNVSVAVGIALYALRYKN